MLQYSTVLVLVPTVENRSVSGISSSFELGSLSPIKTRAQERNDYVCAHSAKETLESTLGRVSSSRV